MTFAELNLDPRVLDAVTAAGYVSPTEIQAQAIPHAMQGRDILGIAQTGTGKTASFSLPMISRLASGRARARMPRSLVLCPTRELAAQVAENFKTYSTNVKLTMALLIGGVSFSDQDKLIDRGVDVLIATPGRLLDHFERGKLMLTGIEIMVVDEADRMLDMGFIPDIERIFKMTPFTRQTLFFSATMPPEITRLTQEFLSNPERVEVARASSAASTVTQELYMVPGGKRDDVAKTKRNKLRELVRQEDETLTNAIIFCNRKRDVAVVHKSLEKHGFQVGCLHGDLDQRIRTQVLNSFRAGELRLLVASDVAARGLDIPDVSHVFNFDVPMQSEDYVHRIGRTGRAGRSGKALMIGSKSDDKLIAKIDEMLGTPVPRIGEVAPEPAPEAAAKPEKKQDKPRSERERPSRARAEREAAPAAAEVTDATPVAALENSPQPEQRPERSNERGGERERPPRERNEAPRQDSQRNDAQRNDSQRNDGRRGARRGRDGGGDDRPVRGLGDHVPAFMLIPLPDLSKSKPAQTGSAASGGVADAA